MSINLLNEQELNKFLTGQICGKITNISVSRNMLFSKKYALENLDLLAKAMAAQWLKVKFRDFLLDRATVPYLEEVKEVTPNSPQWLDKALKQGGKVYQFCPEKVSADKIKSLQLAGHFAEMTAKYYIVSQSKRKKFRLRFDYLKTHGAFSSIEKVLSAYNQFKKEETLSQGIRIIGEYDKGFKIVQLQSRSAFVAEGNAMGHCLGGEDYFERCQAGQIKVYSLRDKKFYPHATLEVKGNMLVQVRGRSDMNLHADYAGYVQSFVKEQDLKVSLGEQAGIGIIEKDNQYYNLYNLPKDKQFELEKLDLSESGLRKLPEWQNLKINGTLDLSTTKIKSLKGCAKAKQLRLYDCDNLALDCLKDLPEEVEVLEDFKFGIEALQYLPKKTNLRKIEFQDDEQAHDFDALRKLPYKLLARLEVVNVSAQFEEARKKAMAPYEIFGKFINGLNIRSVG